MSKTLAEKFEEVRKIQKELYECFTETVGRLKCGPSGREGVYIQSNEKDQSKNISNITKEEAEFIIRKLKEYHGLE